MKTKDITPLTVVYGHSPSYGDPRKVVVLSTDIWTLSTWASADKPFERHESRPAAKYGVTVGVLAVSAPVETSDAELLALAASIDVDQVEQTGTAPRAGRRYNRATGIGVEVVMTKDVVDLETVLETVRLRAKHKADAEAETLARRANGRTILDLSELLGLDLPQMHSGGEIPMGHQALADLLERLARAEGKLS